MGDLIDEQYKWLTDDLGAWCAFMLWEQGHISQEKAAELVVVDLAGFRQFCQAVNI